MSFFNFRSAPISAKVIGLLALLLIVFRCIAVPDHQLGWDVFGYYLYLPAFFIYNDPMLLDHTWLDALMVSYEPSSTLYQLVDLDNGGRVIKYSMGTAVLLMPFFILANLFALIAGAPIDGLSLPYQFTLTAGGMIYALIGLIYFRKILLEFFDDIWSAVILLLIVLGTNYFQLIAFDGTLLTHNFLFTLYAILIWYTIIWHRTPSLKGAIWIGVSLGLIILVRPSEMPAILIPLLWNVFNMRSLKAKLALIKANIRHIIMAVACTLLVGSFQLIYWKSVTDSWLFYSYQNAGEGFEFLSPYVLQFLVSFRKGWFIYTPIMMLAILGIFKLREYKQEIALVTTICVIASIWIMSSWTTWWYAGGSFSARTMLPIYPILALPLGYVIKDLWQRDKRSKLIIAPLLVFFILLNLFQTWQFRNGIIDRERMTSAAYFASFGRTTVPDNYEIFLLVERSTDGKDDILDPGSYNIRELFHEIFLTGENKKGLIMDPHSPFSPSLSISFRELTDKDHVRINAKAEIEIPKGYSGESPRIVATMEHNGESYKYADRGLTYEQLKNGGTFELKIEYLTPEVRSPQDILKVYVWQYDTTAVYLRSFEIEALDPKDPGY